MNIIDFIIEKCFGGSGGSEGSSAPSTGVTAVAYYADREYETNDLGLTKLSDFVPDTTNLQNCKIIMYFFNGAISTYNGYDLIAIYDEKSNQIAFVLQDDMQTIAGIICLTDTEMEGVMLTRGVYWLFNEVKNLEYAYIIWEPTS